MKSEISENGFKFYRQLPENVKLADIKDFYNYGRLKIGMKYIIWANLHKVFYERVVQPYTDMRRLALFIKKNRVGVFMC